MARIDLIGVGKTLGERSGAVATAAGSEASAPSTAGRAAAFAIEDVNLRIHEGETLVILGPSGCGKTTLLKLIAGLIAPDAGEVRYDGVNVKDVTPGERRIGMVFQNYALYPHLTSRTNVLSYFLFKKKTPEWEALKRAKYERTSELMGVELAHLLDRKPTTLSGGEKQRVAVGRCITRDPAVFLLDEPFSNLDQALREKYRLNLKLLLRQFNITTVYVTHDHYEALILADRLAIMGTGRIEQVGTYQEIYDRPRNLFVAGFLNRHVGAPSINLLDAESLPDGSWPSTTRVGVRPEDFRIVGERQPANLRGLVTGTLSLPMMNATILSLRVGEQEVHAEIPGANGASIGERVWLDIARYHLFDKKSGARLSSHPEST
jgi:multiple sugar transport system ATP-binding protein